MAETDCRPQVHACAIRVTSLGPTGAPLVGSTTSYVSDALVTMTFTPVFTDGDEIEDKKRLRRREGELPGPGHLQTGGRGHRPAILRKSSVRSYGRAATFDGSNDYLALTNDTTVPPYSVLFAANQFQGENQTRGILVTHVTGTYAPGLYDPGVGLRTGAIHG